MLDSLPLTRGPVAWLVMAAATLAALWIPDRVWRRRALAGVLLLALALAAARWSVERSGASLSATGPTPAVAAVLGLATVGAVLGWLVRALLRAVSHGLGVGSSTGDRPAGAAAWDTWASRLFGLHLAAALVALAAPHLHSLMGAVTIGALSGVLLDHRAGRVRRFPVALPLAVVALGYLWYTLARVAGPMPVGLLALRDAPYSEAFETLLALPLALAAWCLLGLWPFHAVVRGPLSGLLGAAILVKLVAPVLPHGLAHWQPLLYLLGVLAAWHAAKSPANAALLTVLAAVGLFSGRAAAGWAALGLVAVSALLGARPRLAAHGLVPNRRGRALALGAAIVGASLLPMVVHGGLGAELVYTALVVGAVAGAVR